jgi:sulfide dehydrogenase cytochrome subunit
MLRPTFLLKLSTTTVMFSLLLHTSFMSQALADDDEQECYRYSLNKYSSDKNGQCDDDRDDDDRDDDDRDDDDRDDDDRDDDDRDDASSSSINSQIVAPINLANAAQFVPDHGRLLAAQCAQCHGMNGYSNNSIDHLAGESVAEIVEEMLEMQLESENDLMHFQARGYDYTQIQAMAEYFASLPKTLANPTSTLTQQENN